MKHLESFKLVIYALLIRETKTRFGSNNLGYLWAVLEPIAHILIISMIFGTFSSKIISGVDYPVFVMISISTWFLFNNILNKSTGAIESNRGLLVYHNVKPIDTIFARIILEIYIYITTIFFLYFTFKIIGYDVSIRNFNMFFVVILEVILFAVSLSLFLSILYQFSENAKKIVNIILKPLYYISAVFYPLSIIPEAYRVYFLYNPITNIMDLVRYYYFDDFIKYGSHFYLNTVSLIFLLISLFLFKHLSNNIIKTQ